MRGTALDRYFYFSSGERKGALALIALTVLLFFGVRAFTRWHERQPFDYTTYQSELIAWESKLPAAPVPVVLQLPTAPFDPNDLTARDWQAFGISERAAWGILTYRDKAGGFRRKADVAKLYAVSDSLYARLAPYLVFGETNTRLADSPNNADSELFAFDPNRANATDFQRLGLSERVANNIVKYRERGGQFRRPADFAKIYGIPASQFALLEPYLRFSEAEEIQGQQPPELFAFDPNLANQAELERLGLSTRTAKGLLKYRAAGAIFRRPADLAKVYGIDEGTYARLEPYIRIGEQNAVPVAAEVAVQLVPFDPNTATQQELIALGLPPPVAYGVVRYREAGGQFRSPADFGKLRSVTPEQFARLEPYIRIGGERKVAVPATSPVTVTIEINTATAEDWQGLRGIGPAYTRRILEQKERMGGFGNWDMLRRTPGLPDSVYQRIRPLLTLDAPPVTDIYINRIGEAELIAHPWLTKSQALTLLEFRAAEGGRIKNFKRLQKARVSERVLARVQPLLHFDP